MRFLNYPFLGGSPLPIAKSWLCVNTQATAFDLPSYNIFVLQKDPLWKIFDAFNACDLWCGPRPNQKY